MTDLLHLTLGFADNHQHLVALYYRDKDRRLTKEQHDRLHRLNWLLLEKKEMDLGFREDGPVDPEQPDGERRSQILVKILASISTADTGWKNLGLRTVVEILREAEI